MSVPAWLLPLPDHDEWLDPDLIGCSNGCDDCRTARGWRAEARAKQQAWRERKTRLDALTDEDRAWLTTHGWDGR